MLSVSKVRGRTVSKQTFDTETGRESFIERVEDAYDHFEETGVFAYPEWLYGPPKGELFEVPVQDCPDFGDTARVEFDAGRTAFLSVDMQTDFCGEDGYVDAMGYDLSLTRQAVEPIGDVLEAVRGTDIDVVHTREGHPPDLSDAPFNKLLRSKAAGDGVGIGDTPLDGMGPLLTRGHENWDIIDELAPEPGEPVVDKPTKARSATPTSGWYSTDSASSISSSPGSRPTCVSTPSCARPTTAATGVFCWRTPPARPTPTTATPR